MTLSKYILSFFSAFKWRLSKLDRNVGGSCRISATTSAALFTRSTVFPKAHAVRGTMENYRIENVHSSPSKMGNCSRFPPFIIHPTIAAIEYKLLASARSQIYHLHCVLCIPPCTHHVLAIDKSTASDSRKEQCVLCLASGSCSSPQLHVGQYRPSLKRRETLVGQHFRSPLECAHRPEKQ
eukprot:c15770_g1_i4 orf=316-858(+)